MASSREDRDLRGCVGADEAGRAPGEQAPEAAVLGEGGERAVPREIEQEAVGEERRVAPADEQAERQAVEDAGGLRVSHFVGRDDLGPPAVRLARILAVAEAGPESARDLPEGGALSRGEMRQGPRLRRTRRALGRRGLRRALRRGLALVDLKGFDAMRCRLRRDGRRLHGLLRRLGCGIGAAQAETAETLKGAVAVENRRSGEIDRNRAIGAGHPPANGRAAPGLAAGERLRHGPVRIVDQFRRNLVPGAADDRRAGTADHLRERVRALGEAAGRIHVPEEADGPMRPRRERRRLRPRDRPGGLGVGHRQSGRDARLVGTGAGRAGTHGRR